MKSKLVRLKIWYEHDDGIPPETAAGALEQLVLRSLTVKEGEGIRVHAFEVGNQVQASSRPIPDF